MVKQRKPMITINGKYGDTKKQYDHRRGRHLFFAARAPHKFWIEKGDVVTAFLQGDETELKRVVLLEPPKELNLGPDFCLRLKKNGYGTNDAPVAWYRSWKRLLGTKGCYPTKADPCVFEDLKEGRKRCELRELKRTYWANRTTGPVCAGDQPLLKIGANETSNTVRLFDPKLLKAHIYIRLSRAT